MDYETMQRLALQNNRKLTPARYVKIKKMAQRIAPFIAKSIIKNRIKALETDILAIFQSYEMEIIDIILSNYKVPEAFKEKIVKNSKAQIYTNRLINKIML